MTYILIKILQVKQCVLMGSDSSSNDTSPSKTLRRKVSSNGNFAVMSFRQIRRLIELFRLRAKKGPAPPP